MRYNVFARQWLHFGTSAEVIPEKFTTDDVPDLKELANTALVPFYRESDIRYRHDGRRVLLEGRAWQLWGTFGTQSGAYKRMNEARMDADGPLFNVLTLIVSSDEGEPEVLKYGRSAL